MSQAVRLLSFTAAIMCRSKIYRAGEGGSRRGEKQPFTNCCKNNRRNGARLPRGGGWGCVWPAPARRGSLGTVGDGGAAPTDRAARRSGGGRRPLEGFFPSPAVRTLLSSPLFTRRSGWFVRQQQEEASQGQLSKSPPHPRLFLLLLPV